ncbi:MAG TPA: 23S rRNA (pseudouridine(1915)-N(3))-methyltransferase RlmH [bacterium]|nr:23S rRNA (pseudouridine(1915)-N(3))-methyltransferase RlmH [bacterium]
MSALTILAIGKLKKSGGFADMDRFYRDRIEPFAKLDIIELKESASIADDTAQLLRRIPAGAYVVALREEGKRLDSKAFAALLGQQRDAGRSIAFVVGGAYGFGNVGESIALSLAPWTLNHMLARIVLLEQIYRGYSILSGGKYHHG